MVSNKVTFEILICYFIIYKQYIKNQLEILFPFNFQIFTATKVMTVIIF